MKGLRRKTDECSKEFGVPSLNSELEETAIELLGVTQDNRLKYLGATWANT